MTNTPLEPRRRDRRRAALALFGLLALTFTGCRAVSSTEQRMVSQPSMLFSERPAFVTSVSLLAQTEPGAAATGGGANSGCTSCR
jgi:hypothetical protein